MTTVKSKNLKASILSGAILFSGFAISSVGFAQQACRSIFVTSMVTPAEYVSRFAAEEALVAKIRQSRSSNRLWTVTPMVELRPFIDRMITELDKADRRMERAQTPWALRKGMMARVQILKASLVVAKAMPTYKMTLDLGFRFAALTSGIERLRGVNEFEFVGDNPIAQEVGRLQFMHTVTPEYINNALWIAKNTELVVLPTFAGLSEVDLSRLWARNITVIGFAGRTVKYDGLRGSLTYSLHDSRHLHLYVEDSLDVRLGRTTFSGSGIKKGYQFSEALKEYNRNLKNSAEVEVPLLAELDGYAMEDVLPHDSLTVRRLAVEKLFYQLRHEASLLVTADPMELKQRYKNVIEMEIDAKNPKNGVKAPEITREETDAVIWLADKYRSLGVKVPAFTRESVIAEIEETRRANAKLFRSIDKFFGGIFGN